MIKKWIKISEYLRTILLLIFAIPVIALYFEWYKDNAYFSPHRLNDIKNIAILMYIIVYVIELRTKLKDKDNEIASLKTKLLNYER